MRKLAIALTSVLPLALACETAPQPADGVVVVDSAGVSTVLHGEQAIRDAPLLELEETIRIGSVEGPEETQFFQVVAAVETGEEIYILDHGHNQVRVFGSDGTFHRAIGREGDGPGELRRPLSMGYIHDTVSVLGSRLTMFDPVGNLLGTGPGRVFEENGYLLYARHTEAGWLGVWRTRSSRDIRRGEWFREEMSVHPIDPLTAELGDPIFTYEDAEAQLAGDAGWLIQSYFQAMPTLAIGTDGRVYFTPGDSYRIDVIDGITGAIVRRIAGDMDPPPVTGDLTQRAIEAERATYEEYPEGSEMAMYRDALGVKADLPTPATLPVFGRLVAAGSGSLLALRLDLDEDPARTGDASVWDLFGPDGVLQGRVVLPPGQLILGLTDDGILVRATDEMDVQSVVRYRFAAEKGEG